MAEGQRPMRELLANIDKDMAGIPPPTRAAERTPEEQQRIADLTGDVLRKMAADAQATVMKGLDEAQERLTEQRHKAEHAMKELIAWTDNHADQNRQLAEHCHRLERTVADIVDSVMAIGKAANNGKGG